MTIYFNESSQLSNATRETVLTRLAQKCYQTIIVDGKKEQQELKPRAYYDANPPSKAHWLYKVFHMKVDPESKRGLKFPDDYCHILMNPKDNQENLTKSYLKTLESMSARRQKEIPIRPVFR